MLLKTWWPSHWSYPLQMPFSLGPHESTILTVLIKISNFLGAVDKTPLIKWAEFPFKNHSERYALCENPIEGVFSDFAISSDATDEVLNFPNLGLREQSVSFITLSSRTYCFCHPALILSSSGNPLSVSISPLSAPPGLWGSWQTGIAQNSCLRPSE